MFKMYFYFVAFFYHSLFGWICGANLNDLHRLYETSFFSGEQTNISDCKG